MTKLSFVTGSVEKFQEGQLALKAVKSQIQLERMNIDLPEIQELDSKKIISEKLRAAASHCADAIVVEDTALYFEALEYRLPGPLIKWFVKTLGENGLFAVAEKFGKFKAFAVTTLGYSTKTRDAEFFFEGRVEGVIVAPRGTGFGWDSIFQPAHLSSTFAELSLEQKTKISHRGKAFSELGAHFEALKIN